MFQLKLAHKCVPCKLCTPHDGIQQVCVSKKMGKIYARVRRSLPSQLFPVKVSGELAKGLMYTIDLGGKFREFFPKNQNLK